MADLQDIVVPKLPIAWGDVLNVKDVLAQVLEQRKNELDPLHHRVWFIRLNVHDFFKGSAYRQFDYRDLDLLQRWRLLRSRVMTWLLNASSD